MITYKSFTAYHPKHLVLSSYAVLENGKRIGEVHHYGPSQYGRRSWVAFTNEQIPEIVGNFPTRKEAAYALKGSA